MIITSIAAPGWSVWDTMSIFARGYLVSREVLVKIS